MELKQGYKQTDVGVIPEEWHVQKLDSVVTFFNGKAHENCISDAGDYIVVNSKFISTEGSVAKYSIEKYCQLLKNDVAIVMSDIPNGKALAKCFIIEKEDTYTLNQRIGGLRTLGSKPKFLYYQLNRNKYFLSFDSGSGQTNLRKQEVLDCPVILPPLQEQIAIANALSDMDALIAQTEKLIEKKKAIKQGAMQELLKPKEGWVTKKLGDLAVVYTGKKNNQDKVVDGEYPFFVRSQTIEKINSYSFDGEAILIPGEGNIGKIFHYINGKFDFHQRVYKISDFKNGITGKYIYRYMTEYFGRHALGNSVKATVDSLRLPTIQAFNIPFPIEIQEQERITNILNDIDDNIALQQNKLNKLKQQKQGMMQVLLTGKIRLVS